MDEYQQQILNRQTYITISNFVKTVMEEIDIESSVEERNNIYVDILNYLRDKKSLKFINDFSITSFTKYPMFYKITIIIKFYNGESVIFSANSNLDK